ncbi:MAG: phosphoglucosamine mutase [Blastocatellia bacterium]
MKLLKISINGVRGIVGETFTPELAVSFAQAFGTYLESGRVLTGRDTRRSGPMVHAAVAAGLLSTGCEVVDLGVCPTPSLQLAIGAMGAAGGIAISAGHNPEQWNALKFVRQDGLFLNTTQAEELLDIYHQGEFEKAKWDRVPARIGTGDAIALHMETLSRVFDAAAIRARRLTVAVDCCNGACALLVPRWLASMGCRVLAINDDTNEAFPRSPEIRRETLAQLRAVVQAGHADVGFAHDADGERLGIVTETGEALSEELTLALAAEITLRKTPGPVVTNLSTTGAIEMVAARHGARVIRTPVGTPYISEAIREHNAVIGGEGNGAVAVPRVQPTNDSAAAIGLILEHMALTGESVSALAAGLPRLVMRKHYARIEPNLLYSALQDFRDKAIAAGMDAGAEHMDASDGVKLSWPDGWVHVRASNTESMIRVIAEAATETRVDELLDWARDRLKET